MGEQKSPLRSSYTFRETDLAKMQSKSLENQSGPWTGWSIQAGFRLTERMSLTIERGSKGMERYRACSVADMPAATSARGERFLPESSVTISGWGTDVDGDFAMDGFYDPATEEVHMIRRYTHAPKNPGQVGYPFEYHGKWNGYCIYGTWTAPTDLENCGPFEMWPESEEDLEELMFNLEGASKELVVGAPKG